MFLPQWCRRNKPGQHPEKYSNWDELEISSTYFDIKKSNRYIEITGFYQDAQKKIFAVIGL